MKGRGSNSRELRAALRAAGMMGGMGLLLAATTLAGAILGEYLDGRWGTGPWLALAGTLGGMAAGFVEVVSLARRIAREK